MPVSSRQRRCVRTFVLSTAWLCLIASLQPASAAESVEERWSLQFIQGQPVGYARTRLITDSDAPQTVRYEERVVLKVKRFGTEFSLTVKSESVERPDGDLLRFRQVLENPPGTEQVTQGEVEGTTVSIRVAEGESQSLDLDVQPKANAYLMRTLKSARDWDVGEQRELPMFDPQQHAIDRLTIRAAGRQMTHLRDGRQRELFKVEVAHSLIPSLVEIHWLDPQGEIRKSETNLMQMTSYPVSKDDALQQLVGDFDLAEQLVIPGPGTGEILDRDRVSYRVTASDADPSKLLTDGPNQQVRRIDEQTVEVTVRSSSVDEFPQPPEEQPTPGLLESSHWIDWEHPAVAGLIDSGQLPEDAARKARALERRVHELITDANYSTAMARASEVAQTRSGDCTEHAVLLAALLRSEGIPSRVAIGLVAVPSQQQFVWHMWTEARPGDRWISLDATRGDTGIGCGHIKFGDAVLDDPGINPLARVMAEALSAGKWTIEPVTSEPAD